MAAHFDGVRRGLDAATDAYNRTVGSLETRVLVTARRFRELGAGGREEIATLDVVERATRQLQAPELGGDERETALAPIGVASDAAATAEHTAIAGDASGAERDAQIDAGDRDALTDEDVASDLVAVTEDVSSDVVAVVHVDTEAPRAAQRALALARR